jgi:hypothetical protein
VCSDEDSLLCPNRAQNVVTVDPPGEIGFCFSYPLNWTVRVDERRTHKSQILRVSRISRVPVFLESHVHVTHTSLDSVTEQSPVLHRPDFHQIIQTSICQSTQAVSAATNESRPVRQDADNSFPATRAQLQRVPKG